MALRVLLADESSTIKKVMQLTLQDYGVELKAVPVGEDVYSVAESFKPDVIFADILLPKRNGYEVCQDLKESDDLKQIPVVLMWSGFMDLDEEKFKRCGAEGRLEKPFDANTLRRLVQDLVTRAKENPVAPYLRFPDLPEFEERSTSEEASSGQDSAISLDESQQEDLDDFAQVKLGADAETGSLDSFRVDLGEAGESDTGAFSFDDEEDEFSESDFVMVSSGEALSGRPEASSQQETSSEALTERAPLLKESAGAGQELPKLGSAELEQLVKKQISEELLEKIAREQVREVLESVAWKMIPDIAERIVREELEKLLRESEGALSRST